jgi:hypothetical protein
VIVARVLRLCIATSARQRELPVSDTDTQIDRQSEPKGDGGAGLVFWMLITLSIMGFAPCMILPAWRDYQRADLTERTRAAEVAEATADIDRQRRRLDAVHNDPGVVSRLAQRELEYHHPGEVSIPVSAVMEPEAPRHLHALQPIDPPAPVARVLALAPQRNYDNLFCASPTRETIMALSIGLFVAAFVIFWPRPRPQPSVH